MGATRYQFKSSAKHYVLDMLDIAAASEPVADFDLDFNDDDDSAAERREEARKVMEAKVQRQHAQFYAKIKSDGVKRTSLLHAFENGNVSIQVETRDSQDLTFM